MTERAFRPWVRPLADQMRESRRAVIEFARALPLERWDAASPAGGWSYRDLLAHIGGGNDQLLQKALRAAIAGSLQQIDFDPNTDAENARGVEQRRAWRIEKVIAELEDGGAEMQDLLSRLADEHERTRCGATAMTLGQFLRIVQREDHDAEHLAQLRTALG